MIATAIAVAIVGAPGVPGTAIPSLSFPLACQIGRTCEVQNYVDRDSGSGAKDYRCGHETYQDHNGVDIRLLDMPAQKRGVAVLAAAPGKVLRLRDSMPDISVKDPSAPPLNGQDCGNGVVVGHGGGWETQYCHMAQGSISVKVGQKVATGTPLGRVGLSGNTEYPHMHITVRHDGKVVDPFDPDGAGLAACKASRPLWSAPALAQLVYKQGAVLNAGFAAGPVKPKDIEAGQIPRPDTAADYLVAYGRAIDLQAGDVIGLELRSPAGEVLAKNSLPPITGPEAQHMAYIGVKRPKAGWAGGLYKARFTVTRQGKTALVREFETRL